MWGPQDINWFRFAPVSIDINTINHLYWSYVHQLSYRAGASHCRFLNHCYTTYITAKPEFFFNLKSRPWFGTSMYPPVPLVRKYDWCMMTGAFFFAPSMGKYLDPKRTHKLNMLHHKYHGFSWQNFNSPASQEFLVTTSSAMIILVSTINTEWSTGSCI